MTLARDGVPMGFANGVTSGWRNVEGRCRPSPNTIVHGCHQANSGDPRRDLTDITRCSAYCTMPVKCARNPLDLNCRHDVRN